MFIGLIKNEFIKLFSKAKTYIIIALFILLCLFVLFISHTNEKMYSSEFMIETVENQIKWQKEYIKDTENNEDLSEEEKEQDIRYSKEYLEELEVELKNLKFEARSEENDWRKNYKDQIASLKEEIASFPAKKEATKDDADMIAEIEQNIEELELKLAADTSPGDEHKNSGINYLHFVISLVSGGFLAFGLILFNGDSVSNEYNPGTFKFLLIQPVTRAKVLLSKYFVMASTSTVLIVGVQAIFFAIIGLVKGFGNFERPMLVGLEYEEVVFHGQLMMQKIAGSGYYIPLWNYVLRVLFLEILFIITLTAFAFMISTIAKSSVISNTIAICTLLGTSIAYGISATYNSISHFIFLHFASVDEIATGSIVGSTGSAYFTFPMVVIVSIVSTIVFIAISLGVFKKRDLLI